MSLLTQTFLAPARLLDQKKYNLAVNLVSGISGLSKDRSVMASQALNMGFDKLMFIDSDQSWQWSDLQALFDSDKPIIAGVVPLKKYPLALNFTPHERDLELFKIDHGVPTPKGLERLVQKYPDQTEIEVSLTGTAFTLIDCKVFKKLSDTAEKFIFNSSTHPEPVTCWEFFPSGAMNGIYFGEDWAFCQAAKKAGFSTCINSKVQIAHHGDHVYRIGQEII